MSKNKRAPSILSKYVVCVTAKTAQNKRQTFKYFSTQAEAKAYAKTESGKVQLFRISYDFYEAFK